jgi:hypothetical protein
MSMKVDGLGRLEISLNVLMDVTFMAKVPDIIPITHLRQDTAAALKRRWYMDPKE